MPASTPPRLSVWAFLGFSKNEYEKDLRDAVSRCPVVEVIAVESSHVNGDDLHVRRLASDAGGDELIASIPLASLVEQFAQFVSAAEENSHADSETIRVLLVSSHGQSGTYFLRRLEAVLNEVSGQSDCFRERIAQPLQLTEFRKSVETVLSNTDELRQNPLIDMGAVEQIFSAYGLLDRNLVDEKKDAAIQQMWDQTWGATDFEVRDFFLGGISHITSGKSLLGMDRANDKSISYSQDLSIQDVRRILRTLDAPLDLLILGCCSLGTIEVAYELRHVASWLLMSPSLLYGFIGLSAPAVKVLSDARLGDKKDAGRELVEEIIRFESFRREEIEIRGHNDCLRRGAAFVAVDNEPTRPENENEALDSWNNEKWEAFLVAFDQACEEIDAFLDSDSYQSAMELMSDFHDMVRDSSLMASRCNCSSDDRRSFFTLTRDLLATFHAILFCLRPVTPSYQSSKLKSLSEENMNIVQFFTANHRTSVGCRSQGLGIFAPASKDRLYSVYNGTDAGGLFEFLNRDSRGRQRWRSVLEQGLIGEQVGFPKKKTGHAR